MITAAGYAGNASAAHGSTPTESLFEKIWKRWPTASAQRFT